MLQKHQEWTKWDGELCQALGQLLSKDEPDVVLHAAEAMASLFETLSGLQWLLQDHAVFGQVLERVTCLLNHERERVVNSAALILARLCLYEPACQRLLSHPSASKIFGRLVQCLTHSRTDTAMNASFTIGCLCGSEQSRYLILAKAKELVSGLEALLSKGAESEAGQTACFALSCLASKGDGHTLLMESPSLPGLLDGLLGLLKSGDLDSTWFAAMTVRVFVSRPNGVTQVRKHSALEEQLKRLTVSPSTGSELQEELSACLRKLKRLPKPSPVTVHHQSMASIASWEKLEPESGLEVTYSLFDGDTMLYRGQLCEITLPHSHFQHKLSKSLSLRLNLSTSDGDMSPFSECVEIRMEGVELRPEPPQDLRVISCTATEVRLKWAGPEGDIKTRSFRVYCDNVLLETTTELGTTVGSLSPSTTYTISVCALGPGDTSSSRCSVIVHTADEQDHAPSGLAVDVLGCHKLQIFWAAPAVPLGRLFSYELRLNGCVVYLGKECGHTARHLTASTLYTCTVTAITSRGSYQSRAVTKRTAKNDYVIMNRDLSSPKRQALAPPTAQEISQVKNRTRKLLSTPTSDSDLRKNKHRLPSVVVQSHIPGKSKSSRVMSTERSLGLVAELDANAQLDNTKDVSMLPSERRILLRRDCKEHTLWSTSHPVHPRPKINPVVLLDCQAEKLASDKERLPLINQQITENVRLLQPVSYNWSDLTRTDRQRNTHRKRLVMGSKANSQLKGRLCLSISQSGTTLL